MKSVLSVLAVAALAGVASAQVQTLNGPGLQTFSNGAGSGFGGVLGASTAPSGTNGSLGFEVVGTDLRITFTPATGGSVNDYVALFLDTRAGGFSDAQMSDTADGGRTAISNPTSGGNVNLPISPDFGYAFWDNSNPQVVGFELTAGNTAGHLNFVTGSYIAGTRTAIIPLAVLGNPTQIDWVAVYTSGTGFMSNEAMPGPALGSGNIGFGGQVTVSGFNRYVIPTPGAAALLGLGGLAMARRRR
jgi:hypothetical protein